MCRRRPARRRARCAPRRRRLRVELRRHQDQRLGRRPSGQQRGPGVVDGAPSRRALPSCTVLPPRSTSPWVTTCSAETDPLGDNHGVWPFLATYSICKIAAEATARWSAQRFALPTTIARLSVPYGDRGGWPAVHLHMMMQRIGDPGARGRPQRVPPPARARHRPHGARPPRVGIGARHRRQLGWGRGGEHRRVVHVPRPRSPASRRASSRPSTPSTACSSI